MRWLVAAALLMVAVSTAPAQTPAPLVARIDVLDRGIYDVVLGVTTTHATLEQSTTTIPGKLRQEFGLRYEIAGAPTGARVMLDVVIKYPPPGMDDPTQLNTVVERGFSTVKEIGETVYLGYAFDYLWEIVPGTWSFEIWYQGRKMAEQKFTVTK
jgi:hypothetical protein